MPTPGLQEIKEDMQAHFTKMRVAVEDMKAHADRMEAVEKKTNHIPTDFKETWDKINTAVDSFDEKHTAMITEHKKLTDEYDSIEVKLAELERNNGLSTKEKVEALGAKHMEQYEEFLRMSPDDFDTKRKQALRDIQKKAMYVGSDPDGGFFVPRPMSNLIVSAKRDATPFRQEAAVTSVSGDTFRYMMDIGEMTAVWVKERQARSNSATPKMEEAEIKVHEMYCAPALTQQLLEDAAFPVESWLGGKVGEAFGNLEAYAFLLGSGVGQPRGILTYDSGTTWDTIEQISTGTASVVKGDDLMNIQNRIKEAYGANAKWYMNRLTLLPIRQLKSDNTQYLWQPGLKAGEPNTLLGDPIVKMSYMPTVVDSGLPIMYGDLKKAYQIVDRSVIRVLRDPFTQNPYIVFKTSSRVGGDVVNFEAMKLLKITAAA